MNYFQTSDEVFVPIKLLPFVGIWFFSVTAPTVLVTVVTAVKNQYNVIVKLTD